MSAQQRVCADIFCSIYIEARCKRNGRASRVLLFIEKDEFSGGEVPKEDDGGGDEFGQHVVQSADVGSEIDDEFVQPESNHANNGEDEELQFLVGL